MNSGCTEISAVTFTHIISKKVLGQESKHDLRSTLSLDGRVIQAACIKVITQKHPKHSFWACHHEALLLKQSA